MGDGLLGVTAALLLATALYLARPIASLVDSTGIFHLPTVRFTPRWLLPLGGMVLWLAIVAVARLAPPSGSEDEGAVPRDIRLLRLGLLIGGILLMAKWLFSPASWQEQWFVIVVITDVIVILVALQGLLRVIGERSHQYRTARGGRQRLRDMIAAAVGVAIGQALQWLALGLGHDGLRMSGLAVAGVSTLMLVIGLFYLLVNVGWIRRSLRRPPPSLREILVVPRT